MTMNRNQFENEFSKLIQPASSSRGYYSKGPSPHAAAAARPRQQQVIGEGCDRPLYYGDRVQEERKLISTRMIQSYTTLKTNAVTSSSSQNPEEIKNVYERSHTFDGGRTAANVMTKRDAMASFRPSSDSKITSVHSHPPRELEGWKCTSDSKITSIYGHPPQRVEESRGTPVKFDAGKPSRRSSCSNSGSVYHPAVTADHRLKEEKSKNTAAGDDILKTSRRYSCSKIGSVYHPITDLKLEDSKISSGRGDAQKISRRASCSDTGLSSSYPMSAGHPKLEKSKGSEPVRTEVSTALDRRYSQMLQDNKKLAPPVVANTHVSRRELNLKIFDSSHYPPEATVLTSGDALKIMRRASDSACHPEAVPVVTNGGGTNTLKMMRRATDSAYYPTSSSVERMYHPQNIEKSTRKSSMGVAPDYNKVASVFHPSVKYANSAADRKNMAIPAFHPTEESKTLKCSSKKKLEQGRSRIAKSADKLRFYRWTQSLSKGEVVERKGPTQRTKGCSSEMNMLNHRAALSAFYPNVVPNQVDSKRLVSGASTSPLAGLRSFYYKKRDKIV